MDGATEVLAPLRDSYTALLERIREHALADDRVRALWLHGSTVKGLADRDSDIDLIVTVADGTANDFGPGLADWMAVVAPPLFTKLLYDRILIFLTPNLERFDVMVEEVSGLPRATDRHRALLFEKDPIASQLPEPSPPRGPDPGIVSALLKDFIGEVSMTTGVVSREDWVFGLESVHRSRTLLYQLLAEGNRPLPPYGSKQWSAQLTPEQRDLFAALPGVTATRESVLEAKWATVAAFYRTAPAVAARVGVGWPTELDSAVRNFVRRELGYELPVPAGT